MRIEWKTCLRVGVTAFLLFLAVHYWDQLAGLFVTLLLAAWPLILGGIIAYIINMLMMWFERHLAPKSQKPVWVKLRRPVCLLLAFASLIAFLALLLRLILPQLMSCFSVLLSALPEAFNALNNWLVEDLHIGEWLQGQQINLPQTNEEWRTLLENVISLLINGVGGVMNVAVSATVSVVSSVVTLLMSLIFTLNILGSKEKLHQQLDRLSRRVMGERVRARCLHVLRVMDDCFHSYIAGQCIEAVILGSLCSLGMWILQLPYAVMVGAVVGVLALIPIAGAYIAGAIGAIMVFSVSPMKALVFVIFLVVLQQIEGNLIYPRTVGSTLRLPGIWVLAAVLVGGGVLGIVGMVLFVPITATLYRLLGEWVRKGEAQELPVTTRIAAFVTEDEPDTQTSAPEAVQPEKEEKPAPKPRAARTQGSKKHRGR